MIPHPLFLAVLSTENRLLIAAGLGLLAASMLFVVLRWLVLPGSDKTGPEDRARLSIFPDFPDELRQGRDPFSHGSFTERRSAIRRGGHPVSVWVSDRTGRAEPVSGHVVDRSVRGLGLELDRHVDVERGEILTVRPGKAGDTVPWIQIKVRHVKPISSGCRLGCEFVRVPQGEFLMLFG
jgi:hypothetical protein